MFNATIIGNLTANPVHNETNSGNTVVNFTVAVNGSNETVDYIRVTTWGRLAESCTEMLRKGSKVGVTGTMHCELYEGENGVYLNENLNAVTVEFLANYGKTEEKPRSNTGRIKR